MNELDAIRQRQIARHIVLGTDNHQGYDDIEYLLNLLDEMQVAIDGESKCQRCQHRPKSVEWCDAQFFEIKHIEASGRHTIVSCTGFEQVAQEQ